LTHGNVEHEALQGGGTAQRAMTLQISSTGAQDTCLSFFFQKDLGEPALERQTILDFNEARDDGVAVASAGPYANHLHFAAER